MKHIKLFESFEDSEPELDITEEYSLNIDGLSLTVWYDNENWDNEEDYRNEVTYAAENQNDSLTDELCSELYQYGLTIDDSEDHSYDLEDGWVTYQLREIPHNELAKYPEGIELLKRRGYTDGEIKALSDISDIGII